MAYADVVPTMDENVKPTEGEGLKKPDNTASDVREAAGLSYRQLNSWDVKSSRDSENGWRRFTGAQVLALTIMSALKARGVPAQSMHKLYKWLSVPETAKWMLEMAYMGLVCYLITDLEETFTVENAMDAADFLQAIGENDRAYIYLPLNKIFNRFLEARGRPLTKIKFTLWDFDRITHEAVAKASVSDQERTILSLIKKKEFQKILITVKGGKPVQINIEENFNEIALPDVKKLIEQGKYQRITLIQKDGKLLSAKRDEVVKL